MGVDQYLQLKFWCSFIPPTISAFYQIKVSLLSFRKNTKGLLPLIWIQKYLTSKISLIDKTQIRENVQDPTVPLSFFVFSSGFSIFLIYTIRIYVNKEKWPLYGITFYWKVREERMVRSVALEPNAIQVADKNVLTLMPQWCPKHFFWNNELKSLITQLFILLKNYITTPGGKHDVINKS